MRKRYIIGAIITALALWFLGFSYFLHQVYRGSRSHQQDFSDNMAILTGEKNRIPDAMFFMASYCGQKQKNVLISGVGRLVEVQDVLGNKIYENMNFTLGKHAKNTRENAKEIIEWMRNNNMTEVTVITSDYHMPRSLLELKHLDPHIKVYKYCVISKRNLKFIFYCLKEFHKIIFAHIRHFFENLENAAY
ncbi:MAG: YdcF family protein [Holosporaceae bacterium]|jgi:uncharacterized SAM-binding protein YcdF (DUF218 family)|nr:YdcF family protein [Holosporaceae bacterium]